jgi:ankyrin repeat protein
MRNHLISVSGLSLVAASGLLAAVQGASPPSAVARPTTRGAVATAPATRRSIPESPLCLAIRGQKSREAIDLIGAGADVNFTDEGGGTPLYCAAMFSSTHGPAMLEIAKALVDHGATVDARCIGGFTPLHEACLHGSAEVVEFLLAKGADPLAGEDSEGDTPLHVAAHRGLIAFDPRILEALLSHGVSVNVKNRKGETPLDIASPAGAEFLVKKGGKSGVLAAPAPKPATRP